MGVCFRVDFSSVTICKVYYRFNYDIHPLQQSWLSILVQLDPSVLQQKALKFKRVFKLTFPPFSETVKCKSYSLFVTQEVY